VAVSFPRVRRRWVVLAVVVILLLAAVRLADRGAAIDYYRVIDDHTVAIGTASGPLTWVRVTSLSESSDSINVGVSSIAVPGPGYGGDRVEVDVTLAAPVGTRKVIDASRGVEVQPTCGSLAEPFLPCP
jgi:hypothetical protein